MPRIYFLCKNHQTGTADKSCIPSSRLRMFTFAEAKEKKKENFFRTEEDGRIWKFCRKIVLEIFRIIFTRLRVHVACNSSRGIVHGGGDPRLVFYQGTLWYRRRFKGDSTMFTECRGPRRIEEECIEACMPLVGLSCKPLSSNPRYFAAPPYSIFRSTSIPVTLPRAATSPPVTPPCTPFPPFLSLPLLRPIYNRFFAHPVSKRDFPRCVGRTARDSLGIPTLKGIYLEGSFRVELGNSFPRDGIKRNFRFDEEKRKRDKVDSCIYANDLCDTKLLATFLIPFVATLNEVYTSLESLCSYYALPLQSNFVNWNPSTFLSTFSSSPLLISFAAIMQFRFLPFFDIAFRKRAL